MFIQHSTDCLQLNSISGFVPDTGATKMSGSDPVLRELAWVKETRGTQRAAQASLRQWKLPGGGGDAWDESLRTRSIPPDKDPRPVGAGLGTERAINTSHSSVLAWRIPWTVESRGSQRVGQWLSDFHLHFLSLSIQNELILSVVQCSAILSVVNA